MALYNVEILKAPRNQKALRLICTLSGISEIEIGSRLRSLPLVVKESIPLSEAIAIERRLKRMGIKTRLVRVEIERADTEEELAEVPEKGPRGDEVIEIPDAEVRILRSFGPAKPKTRFKRKRMALKRRWASWLILFIAIVAVSSVSWYLLDLTNRRHLEIEIQMYIGQWSQTLAQQDLTLDKGFPPERIFYKLDEIEGKIERLIALVKSQDRATSLRTQFEQAKWGSQSLIRDLAFRRSLEDAGYPIHPTCLVDRGIVRGFSELPESTLLRIQLLGENAIESVYFAARISGGTFKLIIDPSIDQNIYDAQATVASLSQQSKEIQRWAERKFALSEVCKAYLPRGRRARAPAEKLATTQPQAPKESPELRTSSKAGISLADPGTDLARSRELEDHIIEWTDTILSSQQYDLADEADVLERIYRRLLDLEVRIDQLIGLLESSVERNIWIQKREDVYGSFIDIRQDIEAAYDNYSKGKNPFSLEGAIRRNLKNRGFQQANVLVIDSPQKTNAFVIEIEIGPGEKEDVLVSLALTLQKELQGSNLSIERVSLRHAGATLWWTPDQIRDAIDALSLPDGPRRCASMLEFSATSIPPP